MIEAFVQALVNVCRPDIALGIILATTLAVIVGVIPAMLTT
jgi:hypothetical protein